MIYYCFTSENSKQLCSTLMVEKVNVKEQNWGLLLVPKNTHAHLFRWTNVQVCKKKNCDHLHGLFFYAWLNKMSFSRFLLCQMGNYRRLCCCFFVCWASTYIIAATLSHALKLYSAAFLLPPSSKVEDHRAGVSRFASNDWFRER